MKCRSRKRGAIVFVILVILILIFSVERVVFDTLGQMWGTLIINCATALCSLTGIAGVWINEKIAIGMYSVWNLISIGLNLVIILIYNDVGLLSKKEHYLGLSVGNDNWWRTHGMGCRETGDEEGSGNDDSGTVECTASYATIETIHATVYMFLALITLLLSVCLLFARKKYIPEDDESFNFVSVSRYQSSNRTQRNWSYSTNDTTISL